MNNITTVAAPPLPPLYTEPCTKETWVQIRRNELLALFSNQVFGTTPPKSSYNLSFNPIPAVPLQTVTLTLSTTLGKTALPFDLYLPTHSAPCPIVLFLSIWSRAEMDFTQEGQLPLPLLFAAGYGAAVVYTQDISPDCPDGFSTGLLPLFETNLQNRLPNAIGAVGLWAFGLQRVMDCLCQLSFVDKTRVVVAGHSRGGKTALWAAAQDTRFCAVFANESGCTGAALSRYKQGEQIANINNTFPYWFCGAYKSYNQHPAAAPFDQHMLLALVAPRPLYIASAAKDIWADPAAEYAGLYHCQGAYALYGYPPLLPPAPPAVGNQVRAQQVAYHLRQGQHGLTKADWSFFLQFMDTL